MISRNSILFLLGLCIGANLCSAQTFSNYNIFNSDIAFETDAVQTADGAWVAAVYHFVLGQGDKVLVARSEDNGQTWTDVVQFDDVVDPVLTLAPDGTVILALQRGTFAGTNLELHRSLDNGNTWEYYSALPSSGFADKPYLAFDSEGRLYCTYIIFDFGFNIVEVARSDDNGQTWNAPTTFLDPVNIYLTGSFVAVGNDDVVYVSWGESASGKVFFTKSDDFGDSWFEPLEIATYPVVDYSPMTYIINNKISDFIGIITTIAHSNTEMLLSYSYNAGATWTSKLLDSTATNPSALVQANGSVHIAYNHFPGNYDDGFYSEMRYITSTDSCVTFSEPLVLEEGEADYLYSTYIGEYQAMSVGLDSELHVTWVRKTLDIGFSHSVIDIPADTSGEIDTTQVSISELIKDDYQKLLFAPNPTLGMSVVDGVNNNSSILVYNQYGKLCKTIKVINNQIDLTSLPDGLYIIKTDASAGKIVKISN
jgi:hypothetical protein